VNIVSGSSQVGLLGSDLASTSNNLSFNFSGTDNGYLLFQTPVLFTGFDFWCSASAAFPPSCSDQASAGEALATNGPTEATPLSGNLVIASGGTLMGSDIVYNVDRSWTTNGHTFTVTGTITTDGKITSVPEPSSLALVGFGVGTIILRLCRSTGSL
jgi:hypothetical protein